MDQDQGTLFGNLSSNDQVDYLSKNVVDSPADPEEQEAPEQEPVSQNTEPEEPDEDTEAPDEGQDEQPDASEGNEEANLYTPEEYLTIDDPGLVDPKRLPPDARFVHERDLKYFNERVLPQLQSMNAELVALREYRARVEAQQAAALAQKGAEKEVDYDAITPDQIASFAQMEAARSLGVAKLDMTDPQHMAALSYVTTEVTNRIAQAKAEAAAMKRQKAETMAREQRITQELGMYKQRLMQEPNFEAIDRYALQSLNNLPHPVYMAIQQDLHSGDVRRVDAVYRFFEKRWHSEMENRKKIEQTAKAATVKAPKLTGGSMANGSEKREFTMSKWSSGNSKDQVSMLVESGLV